MIPHECSLSYIPFFVSHCIILTSRSSLKNLTSLISVVPRSLITCISYHSKLLMDPVFFQITIDIN